MTEGVCDVFCYLIFEVPSLIHIRIDQNQCKPLSPFRGCEQYFIFNQTL